MSQLFFCCQIGSQNVWLGNTELASPPPSGASLMHRFHLLTFFVSDIRRLFSPHQTSVWFGDLQGHLYILPLPYMLALSKHFARLRP